MPSSRREHNTGRSSSGRTPGGRTPLCQCREGARRDPVDNVRAFHLGAYPVLWTVRITAAKPMDPVFAMAGSDPVDGGSHLDQFSRDTAVAGAQRPVGQTLPLLPYIGRGRCSSVCIAMPVAALGRVARASSLVDRRRVLQPVEPLRLEPPLPSVKAGSVQPRWQ